MTETIIGLVSYQILILHRTDSYADIFATHPEIPEKIYALRKKYESAFGLFETHFEEFCKSLTRGDERTRRALKLVTPSELADFARTGELPAGLEDRRSGVVISHTPVTKIFYGSDGQTLLKLIKKNEEEHTPQIPRPTINGQTVYGKGKISGVCQVITDYDQVSFLEEGKILVVPSTLPKYNHIYLRAKAIITDEGGVLAHAAIFCRENHIPGIVGTKNATQIIKNGTAVEMYTQTGIVKILK